MRKIERELPQFLLELIKDPSILMKKQEDAPFTFDQLNQLTKLAIEHLEKQPNLINLRDNDHFKNVLIIGDTHGFLNSTIRIVQPFLNEKVDSLLFLGDYVDRGPHSLLNFTYVLGMMIAWPERVVVLRGNHEDLHVNGYYNFLYDLFDYYPYFYDYKNIEALIDELYNHLSLAAITPRGTIAFHGGIPQNMKEISELKLIPKPHGDISKLPNVVQRYKATKLLKQLLWNDPREEQRKKFSKSNRGPGIKFFNEMIVDEFLLKSKANRIVRAHEASRGGFNAIFSAKLITLISTEPFFGHVLKGHTLQEKGDETILRDLDFHPMKTF